MTAGLQGQPWDFRIIRIILRLTTPNLYACTGRFVRMFTVCDVGIGAA
jgi:hypothetical protein